METALRLLLSAVHWHSLSAARSNFVSWPALLKSVFLKEFAVCCD